MAQLKPSLRWHAVSRRVSLRRAFSLPAAWRTLVKDLFDPYRPERHYMRGPGPKWNESHARRAPVAAPNEGNLVRVPV